MSTCRRGPDHHPHHCSYEHADLVESYRTARAAQEERAEEWSKGYAAELEAFYRDVERPLVFKDWLQHR